MNTMNKIIVRLLSLLCLFSLIQEKASSQNTSQYRIGVGFSSSIWSKIERFEFRMNDQVLVLDSTTGPIAYFPKKLSAGQTYTISQTAGPRSCNFMNDHTGTIGNQDVVVLSNCGMPSLTIVKMNTTGIESGESFKFSDGYGRTLTLPFNTVANLGGFPVGDPWSIQQIAGPRPCKITINSSVVPPSSGTPYIIRCDCKKVLPPNPPPTIKYDLVSRSSDNKITATYYETAAPVIGGMSDAAGGNEGRYIAFVSYAKGIDGSLGKYRQIFWRDRSTGVTKLISRNATGEEANGDNHAPSISADGETVAFESYASNLSPSDNNGARDIYVWKQATGKVQLVSKTPSGESANSESLEPAVSGDGNIIAFSSNASNISESSKGGINVFVHDMLTGTTQLISTDFETGKGAGGNVPSISEDGTRIAFCSASNRLVKNDNNNLWDIFLWQKGTPGLKRISLTATGGERNQGTESASRVVAPAISGDGRMIAYATTATNVVPDDTNGMQDVFLYNIETGSVKRVSTGKNGEEGNGDSPIDQGIRIGISYNGSWVSFNTNATNLGVPKGNILVKHTVTDSIIPVTTVATSSTARPMLSRFGNFVIAGTSEKYDKRYPSSGIFTFYNNTATCAGCPK